MGDLTRRIVSGLRPRTMWLAVALWLAFSAWFFSVGPYGVMAEQGGVPDEDFGRSADDVDARLANMTADVEADYRTFLWADFAFAGAYGFAWFAIIARWCGRFASPRWWAVAWLPVAAAAADIVENVAMFAALSGSGAGLFVAAQSIKMVLAFAAFGLAAVAALWMVGHAVAHPVKRTRR